MKHAFPGLHFAGLTLALLFLCSGMLASKPAQSMESSRETVLAASTRAIELTAAPVRVKLVSGRGDATTNLGKVLQSLSPSRSLYLEVAGLQAVKQPGTLFHLYLDLPQHVAPKPGNAWHIGSINFYNAVPGPDAPKDKPSLPTTIDIGGVLRNLRSSQKLTADSTITIMATHPPEAGSKPMIGHLAIIEK
jgi:hypothetical protein